MERLLTRDEFREAVFTRDGYKCVICGDTSKLDAHHIIERRLWANGGYYLNNGATLCDKGPIDGCHAKAEATILSVEDIRIAANIIKPIIPEDMYSDYIYDKWGNTILSSGKRSKGPLFYDESVQKVLKTHPDFESLFINYVKYPRTYHLPWSSGKTDDDRTLSNTEHFKNKRVIVTRKLDGENFTGYNDYCHARSIDSKNHYTRNWAKKYWSERSYLLASNERICAENLYAVHSIKYNNLPSYLIGFSFWTDDTCESWDNTVLNFQILNMSVVPVLYDGIFNEQLIKDLHTAKDDLIHEGYVVRLADSFKYKDFNKSVAKYVRKNHVQSQQHWFYGKNNHEVNELLNE